MTPTEIHQLYKKITAFIAKQKIVEALYYLKRLNEEYHSSEINNRIEDITQRYTYLLNYFTNGVNDPERQNIYQKIVSDTFIVSCKLRELLLIKEANNFEFSQMRYFPLREQKQSKQLLYELNRTERLQNIGEAENPKEKRKEIETEFENALDYLFNAFWLSSNDLRMALNGIYAKIISDEYSETVVKSMLVSALTFSLWRTFDEKKILMLFDACYSSDVYTSQRALVGLVFVLTRYNAFIPYFPKIKDRLLLLVDNAEKVEELKNIFFQIIATTETEEVTRKLREEIYPELIKLKPLIEDKKIEELFNTDEWGELNPEWKDTLQGSGVYDKMEEFAELEKSGSDVYMSTFAEMKSHSFFNTFANWLLPFDMQHSSLQMLFDESENSIFSIFLRSPMMCNSDKYSFSLSMVNMPEMQRNIMKQNFSEASEQLKESQKSELLYSQSQKANTVSKHYVQDLFRFFKLHPQRGNFSDMFSTSLLLHKTYLFDLLANHSDIKRTIAEFYFSKKLYEQALELYQKIENEEGNKADFYQRMGYCYQQTSQFVEALKAYKKSDLIQGNDFWTIRKIAMCYRLLGKVEKSIPFYEELKRLRPNNISVRLQLVDCWVMLHKPKEALNELISLNNEYPNHQKILRKTIYLALLDSNLAQANYFHSVLLEQFDLIEEDYLIAGHIAWIMNKNEEAIHFYKKAFETLELDKQKMSQLFEKNRKILLNNGIDQEEILLLKESILLHS